MVTKIGVATPTRACDHGLQSLSHYNGREREPVNVSTTPNTLMGLLNLESMVCAQEEQGMRDGHCLVPSTQAGQAKWQREGACPAPRHTP